MPRFVRLAIVAALLLTACAPTPPTAPAAKSEAPAATAAPKPTEPTKPTAAPDPTTAAAAPKPTEAAAKPTAAPAPTTAAAAPAPAKHGTSLSWPPSRSHIPVPIASMDAPVTWFGATHWLTNLLYDCLIWRKAEGGGYVWAGGRALGARQRHHLALLPPTEPDLPQRRGAGCQRRQVEHRAGVAQGVHGPPAWQFISDVKVVDPRTVDVLTARPFAYLEFDISYNGCELLPPNISSRSATKRSPGSRSAPGRTSSTELAANQKYTFEAWDGYWGGRPEVDRVVYQVIPEAASQLAALLAGQVDLVANVPIPDRDAS